MTIPTINVECPYCSSKVYGSPSNIDSGLRKHLEYCAIKGIKEWLLEASKVDMLRLILFLVRNSPESSEVIYRYIMEATNG